ncbi:DUF4041 domain-containing protein [Subtercola endophyticus]|uniref:DUF4041 domain-containing protein n=1 Tax=Subtercola endophyticus TaxID=2895559 RepID=UPI001E3647CD|nr:DUF4041 domain-containing protein [Subtercola endophyticus]UFS59064.1 DUF4041 domain-containing protein [Subtercola endophyticus]
MANAAAGWYDDGSGRQRWWDGTQWTEYFQDDVRPPASRREARAQQEVVTPVANAQATSVPIAIDRLSKRDARDLATRLQAECERLAAIVDKHGLKTFADIDSYRAQAEAAMAAERVELEVRLAELNRSLQEVEMRRQSAEADVAGLNAQRIEIAATIELQNVGLFDFEHPAQSSAQLSTQLESLRASIKERIRLKQAVITATGFTFNGSTALGKKFTDNMAKVLLRAYNAEAENAIKTTKAGNLHVAQTRLTRAAEQIAKSGEMASLRIDSQFHFLRLKEIELANEHLMTVQREKELERERRAELREQQKAEQELRREGERLQKEKAHYAAAIAALAANGDLEGVERMNAKLEDVQRAIDDVDYRTANIRAGYVYVISNVGAFGERMVKIGMTRRLEPMDRVNELGDASVPFRFDVHALVFADDAVGVEAMLHQTFAAQRVNRVNLRREFFYTTPAEVLAALKAQSVEVVEYTIGAVAEEFRASTGNVLVT